MPNLFKRPLSPPLSKLFDRPTASKGGGGRIFGDYAINLPDPAIVGNGYTINQITGPTSYRELTSDGTVYRDANGDAISEPWWLPGGAKMHVDFFNGRFYWNGAVKALSDLTAIGDGTYTLPYSAIGMTWTGDYTLLEEVILTIGPATTTGVAFGWYINGSNFQITQVLGSNTSGVDRRWLSHGGNPNTVNSYQFEASIMDANGSDLTTGVGINRSVWSVPSSGLARSFASRPVVGTSANGTLIAPVTLHFGRHPATGVKATGVDLRGVTLWPWAMSEVDTRHAVDLNRCRPVHFLGDSFLTHGVFRAAFKALTDPSGYIMMSQDGVGTTTLQQQYDPPRFAARPWTWDSTLIILDGSLELTGTAAISAIQSMVSKLSHNDWAYIQSNPINPIGDSRRTDWDAYDAAIQAFCGPDHYIPTLAAFQAANDGSANDLADVANGLWPRSLRGDSTHPNTAGYLLEASLTYSWMQSKGLIPS